MEDCSLKIEYRVQIGKDPVSSKLVLPIDSWRLTLDNLILERPRVLGLDKWNQLRSCR